MKRLTLACSDTRGGEPLLASWSRAGEAPRGGVSDGLRLEPLQRGEPATARRSERSRGCSA
jgi:hypothetical protein